MRKVFLFGRITRLRFLVSFAGLLYAMIDMAIQSQWSFQYILATLVSVIFVVWGIFWIYLLGIVINQKTNTVKLFLGLSEQTIHERQLHHVASMDVVKDGNMGMYFVIHYKTGGTERFYYKFYRLSIIEELQFKRIKRSLAKLTF